MELGNGIVRTPRGLTVAGTRITLYAIMDYVVAGWSPERIEAWLPLSRDQVDCALAYIDAHRDEVEVEYQQVLREAEETRAYWEERNRRRMGDARSRPLSPEKAALMERIRRHREHVAA